MYWYTVGYLIGAGILCNILNLSLDKMYHPEFQAGIFLPSRGMYWYILKLKFRTAWPWVRDGN